MPLLSLGVNDAFADTVFNQKLLLCRRNPCQALPSDPLGPQALSYNTGRI